MPQNAPRPHFSNFRKTVTSSSKCQIDQKLEYDLTLLSGEMTLFLTQKNDLYAKCVRYHKLILESLHLKCNSWLRKASFLHEEASRKPPLFKDPKTPTRWAYNNHFHNIWTNIHFFCLIPPPALASALKDAEKRWKMNRHEVSAVFSGEQGCLMRWCYFNSLFSSNTFYTTAVEVSVSPWFCAQYEK